MTNSVLIYCRPGFEKEAAAEIQTELGSRGQAGFVKAKPESGYIVFQGYDKVPTYGTDRLDWRDLVFARQLVFLEGDMLTLPGGDRITPLLAALLELDERFSEVRLETADTNEAKSLSAFLRKFTAPLVSVLRKNNILDKKAQKTLHLFFLNSTAVYIGWSTPDNASPWELGIPRLRFPPDAPSRSTLKLEEAFLHFLDKPTQDDWLREGRTAVDLGACPGGWTWQLVKRGLLVTAIDNGAMDAKLMASGQIEHLRVDGFRYRPERPVTWLVCDMIEKPQRIAELMAQWLARGDAQRAMFNLKLPMKKRFEEVETCFNLIADIMGNRSYYLEAKQLYHDREEITVYLCVD